MKEIAPPLNEESQKAEWQRLRAARAALRKVNAIRKAAASASSSETGQENGNGNRD